MSTDTAHSLHNQECGWISHIEQVVCFLRLHSVAIRKQAVHTARCKIQHGVTRRSVSRLIPSPEETAKAGGVVSRRDVLRAREQHERGQSTQTVEADGTSPRDQCRSFRRRKTTVFLV